MFKPIKVHAGKNVITLPKGGDKCAYCEAEMSDGGQDHILWKVCSTECDFAMSYLLDGISESEVRHLWEEMRADPEKLKAAVQRMNSVTFIDDSDEGCN